MAQQKVWVKGKVTDTITINRHGFNSIIIEIITDSLKKERAAKLLEIEKLRKQSKQDTTKRKENFLRISKLRTEWAKNDIIQVADDGLFKIHIGLTDSLLFRSNRFIEQKHLVADLLKRDSIHIQLEPEKCVPYVPCNEKEPKLYVVVAEKIELKSRNLYYCDTRRVSWDNRYEAKYTLIKNVYGELKTDTIDFIIYDHYGAPPFSKYKHVLLFLSEHCGKLYHEKYQYFDVYPTVDGRWARPGDPYELEFDKKKLSRTVKAKKIAFQPSVVFIPADFRSYREDRTFQEPYFRLEDDLVFPVMGAYAEDLFEIKKQGVLKIRGYKPE